MDTKYAKEKQELENSASEKQRKAANPQNSVWVEASAGTGKTKVLSDRVLRLLLDGVEPIRLLCLTYTKAAASEMRTRISERLSEWAVEPDDKLDKHLIELLGDELKSAKDLENYRKKARTLFAELLDTPGGVKIQTLHSFCTDILKRFPLEAGVSPYFTVMEDDESKTALDQIKNEIVQAENYIDNDDIIAANNYLFNNVSESTYDEMIGKIVEARQKMAKIMTKYGDIYGFLSVLAAKLGVKDGDTVESLKAEFMTSLSNKIGELRANIAAWNYGSGSRDTEKVQKLAKVIENGFIASDYEIYKSCFLKQDNKVFTDEKYIASQTAQSYDSELMNRFFAEAARLEEFEKKLLREKLYQSTKAAFMLAQEINRRYDEYKSSKSCMDFDDLIKCTCNLLKESPARQWVMYKLDGGINHILVDEAQDTSPEQWEIIADLCSEFFSGEGQKNENRTIFVVGDRKQSIYSFQGADLINFDKMSDKFRKDVRAAGKNFEDVNMEISFRSAPKILEVVNRIFAQGPATDGVVVGDHKVDHKPYRVGQFAKVTIMPLLETEKGEKTQKSNEYQKAPTERVYKVATVTKMAEAVARRIKEMIASQANEKKPLRYRDIMVLVSKRGEFVPEFIRACEKERVAISGADKMVLSKQIAVQDLLSLCKFLLFPQDDLSLAEALTSPLFSIDEKLLEDACWNRQDYTLWERLQEMDNQQAKTICSQLWTLLKNLDYIRPYELFNYVLSDLGKRRKFIERMGREVEDVLDEFINMTLDYEQREIPTLQGFVSWFEQNEREIKRDSDDPEIDAVRLLTVHHSKGLQAPVVILPCAGLLPNTDKENAFLHDDDLGYYPLGSAYYEDSCLKIHAQNVEKAMQEYHRLLYVALTRAEDQLIIGAYGKRNAKSWYELCRQTFDKGTEPSKIDIEMVSEKHVEKEEKKKSLLAQKSYAYEMWIDKNITGAEDNILKPYNPSKSEEDEKNLPDSASPLTDNQRFYRRGTLIHRLLQFLPQNSGDKEKSIDLFLQKYADDFSAEECAQIKDEVLRLINAPEFADIFGEYSRAEVPVMGAVGNKIISAQIDRLVVMPDKIKIVDFKTNRPPAKDVAHTSPQYINQLAAYAELMRQIYPNKPIETYILWTNETRLMQVA